MMQERDRTALARLSREGLVPLSDKRILDVGCGTGQWIRRLVDWGARPEGIVGIDLLEDRIREARRRCPSGVTLRSASALDPLGDEEFDLVLQSTVFTSVLDPTARKRIARNMIRALRPGGLVLWYDFRVDNPRNSDVRGVSKREIRRLFDGCRIELERITLAPPLVRRLAPVSWVLCALLSRFPPLCTHYLGTIRKP